MIREQKLPDDGRLGFVEVGVDPDREGDVSFGERLLVSQAGDEIYHVRWERRHRWWSQWLSD